jgi:hypothetical protein
MLKSSLKGTVEMVEEEEEGKCPLEPPNKSEH